MGSNGRWSSSSCKRPRRVACRTGAGSWLVPRAAVPETGAARVCADAGARFAVPRTGYENVLLQAAAGKAPVWLGYVRSGDSWTALDRR